MSDFFTEAANEADAELSGSGVDTGSAEPTTSTTPEVSTSPTPTTEPSAPGEPVSTTGEQAPTETPWWQDRLDDTVDVNGEQVPLRELRDRGLRQADYTRKTQELAEVRKAAEWAADFQAQLQRDPVGTLQQLAIQYRLIDADSTDFDPQEPNPWAPEVHELRSEVQSLRLARIEEDIRREVRDVKSRYTDFKDDEILPMIAELGQNGVGVTIEQGYWLWKGQQASKQEAAAAQAKIKADELTRIEEAKRQAQVVPGRSPAATGDDESRYSNMSFDEIAAEVWDSLQ